MGRMHILLLLILPCVAPFSALRLSPGLSPSGTFSLRSRYGEGPPAPGLRWSLAHPGRRTLMPRATTSTPEGKPAASVIGVEGEESDSPQKYDEGNDLVESMPWSNFQSWALRDNLARYVVLIPTPDGKEQKVFALWRAMTKDLVELSGYDIQFLRKMHQRHLDTDTPDGEEAPSMLKETPGVLPLLDEFEFERSGGVSGRAYGLPGIADGTPVQTSVVAEVEVTVPKGYVRTEDGSAAYELGVPSGEFYSLDGTGGAGEKARRLMLEASVRAAAAARGAMSNTPVAGARFAAAGMEEEDPDMMLVRLGGLTAVLLAGATAMDMLSHHLTVNVFWT